jgi:hypothetical protein
VTTAPVDLFLQSSDGKFVKIDERGESAQLTNTNRLDVLFYATLGEPVQPYYEAARFPGNTTLRVSIDFVAPPQDVGVELRLFNGTLVFYRPPRYYSQYADGSTVVEEISVPEQPQSYVFTIEAVGGGTAGIYRLGDEERPVGEINGGGGNVSNDDYIPLTDDYTTMVPEGNSSSPTGTSGLVPNATFAAPIDNGSNYTLDGPESNPAKLDNNTTQMFTYPIIQ